MNHQPACGQGSPPGTLGRRGTDAAAGERTASGDPRLSLEERYGSHEGYVAAVRAAAGKAFAEGFLLPADRDRLIRQASESAVLR
ncbi:hypothetical protein EH244_21505 [Variovorax beijingensis]|uniref:Alpha/beta hydrolase domain-containing protein n=1 Tax=Variovorax beijingensis TaxID=2496117 RepID=A0A3P3EJ11_9BURK|nr:hypothetical protein EH244_21505 [Variovorax beijingensis]RSZ33901.1 hypothetical protein EJO66_18205 [Variovorax beijingensis]